MSTLPQPSLFCWRDFDVSPEILRIASVLDALPDEALVRSLEAARKKKRDDYPLRALWRSAVAGILCGHGKISELIRELNRNAELYDDHGVIPLIPPRNLLAQSENPIRPLGLKRHDTIYTGPTGEVYCKIAPMEPEPEKAFARMQFTGFEKDRGTLKFRCPAAAFGVECRNRDACQCAPLVRDGSFGRVVRVPLEKDRRVFLPQHFHSQGFEKGYKRRTAVERVNSRLDNVHGFENTALRSQDRIALRVGLVMLVMLASAKSWVLAGKEENIRRILRPAA